MSWNLLVIAHPADAEKLMNAKPDDPRWPWTWMDHDAATLSLLGAVLDGREPNDDALGFLEWSYLAAEEGNEGPWVSALPEPLVQFVRAMRDRGSVAAAWAAADFMSSFDEGELEAFLVTLQTLIADADREGQAVLFWQQS